MLRQLYSVLLLLAVPFIVLRLYLKSIALPAYRYRIGERFARFDSPVNWPGDKPTIWVHAVSVGEVVAAAPLVKVLQAQGTNIVLTTTTPTGSDRVQAMFGDSLFHVYVPYDLGFLVRRFIKQLKPSLLIIMETELWPNMLHHSRQQGVKLLLANARLSEKSAAGYRRFAGLTGRMLHALDHIAAQAQSDADRFLALGANADAVSVTGSLKFYVEVGSDGDSPSAIFESVAASNRPVIIAASTREGEEEKVIAAFKKVKEDTRRPLLLLVPRHPERFDKVAKQCVDEGLTLQRRSSDTALELTTDVLLGDSMGELLRYYKLADIAFVGGSLVDTGCQNVLEPAAVGLPILVGPSQFNFATICEQLEAAGALTTVQDANGLAEQLQQLLNDPEKRLAMGTAGSRLVNDNRQALPQLSKIVDDLLAQS
ncbi:MAG: lipid IV(A) 3-deoxy-D-manno-octulosonic acid transferase [Pseudomonadales bacterium]|nr:lipid IV(A) 3-deoxy-D-manno-octulosonic acid transferase [Pseudomonadales bacterium]